MRHTLISRFTDLFCEKFIAILELSDMLLKDDISENYVCRHGDDCLSFAEIISLCIEYTCTCNYTIMEYL